MLLIFYCETNETVNETCSRCASPYPLHCQTFAIAMVTLTCWDCWYARNVKLSIGSMNA